MVYSFLSSFLINFIIIGQFHTFEEYFMVIALHEGMRKVTKFTLQSHYFYIKVA